MNRMLSTLDRAGETISEGFLSNAFGKRGAVLFLVLLGGLVPAGSFVNALWVGVILLVNWSPTDFGLTVVGFYSLCVGLVAVGMIGVGIDIKTMAKMPKATAAN